MKRNKCIGIAGWKNSGKTSLVSNLIAELIADGLSVSTIKHAHHNFDLDQPGTDTFKHREAGAGEVAIVSSRRWAIQHELANEQEPSLDDVLEKLSPCDVVLVEGYKRENIPKIEILAPDTKEKDYLWPNDSTVFLLACDNEVEGCDLAQFNRSDAKAIAQVISKQILKSEEHGSEILKASG